ncbi:hypothetical protein [Williamsia sp.]|uniref:hypothetical protein n=1 Tax=Williamsia sp. TaxID=1872085 RepID=UPI002F93A160
MFGILGNAIMMTQYLQSVLGKSPLSAALWSLLPSIVIAFVAPLSAVLAARIGRPPVMVHNRRLPGDRWRPPPNSVVLVLTALAAIRVLRQPADTASSPTAVY